jgi:ferritin
MSTIPTKLAALLTEQITDEFQSHNNYLAMSAFFERGAFKGFAHWMKLQAQEENAHAYRIFDYLVSRGVDVIIEGLKAPKTQFKSPADVFETALGNEYKTTANIHKIYDAALKEKDFPTLEMLNWFLKEQVEEEEQSNEILDRIKLAGSDVSALLMLDREAGERK